MLVTLPRTLHGMFRFQPISEPTPHRQAQELLLRDIPLLLSIALCGLTVLGGRALDQ